MEQNNYIIPKSYTIYVKPTELEISTRKLEGYKKFCEIIQWGRRNPVLFAKDFFGVEMLDFQAWALMETWAKPYALWAFSRSAGKTTLDAVYLMLKSVLFNNYNSIICSGTGAQSQESFSKLEQIAKNQLATFTGLTEFYLGNVVSNANTDGFIHNPASFSTRLFNNSTIKTVNSNIDHQRGRRANLVIFDEGGFMEENMIMVYTAYTANDSSFALGGDINLEAIPKKIPNQIMFTSSVSQIGSPFWKRYREYSKRMIMGDDRYFCAQIDADVVMNATYHGKIYPVALLTQETIDQELRNNRPRALREYFNIFETAGNANQIIKRQWIARNSMQYIPETYNVDNVSEYIIAYDPARTIDNSIVSVAKLFYDETKGWMLKLVNCINFMELGQKIRKPMRSPEQVEQLRKIALAYNGTKANDYDLIELYVDKGAGGGALYINDVMMEDWYEEGHDGDPKYKHHGFIDKEQYPEMISKFPDACKNYHAIVPSQYKSLMYEALIQNVQNDLIIFPEEYNYRGFLNIVDVDEDMIIAKRNELQAKGLNEDQIALELSELNSAKTRVYKLSMEEELALAQINLMKEEVVNMCRFKTEGQKDRFSLPSHKDAENGGVSDNTLNDDRSYTLALLSWGLTQRRNKDRLNRTPKKKGAELVNKMPMRKGKQLKQFS